MIVGYYRKKLGFTAEISVNNRFESAELTDRSVVSDVAVNHKSVKLIVFAVLIGNGISKLERFFKAIVCFIYRRLKVRVAAGNKSYDGSEVGFILRSFNADKPACQSHYNRCDGNDK